MDEGARFFVHYGPDLEIQGGWPEIAFRGAKYARTGTVDDNYGKNR